jgi:hypothetical protein
VGHFDVDASPPIASALAYDPTIEFRSARRCCWIVPLAADEKSYCPPSIKMASAMMVVAGTRPDRRDVDRTKAENSHPKCVIKQLQDDNHIPSYCVIDRTHEGHSFHSAIVCHHFDGFVFPGQANAMECSFSRAYEN